MIFIYTILSTHFPPYLRVKRHCYQSKLFYWKLLKHFKCLTVLKTIFLYILLRFSSVKNTEFVLIYKTRAKIFSQNNNAKIISWQLGLKYLENRISFNKTCAQVSWLAIYKTISKWITVFGVFDFVVYTWYH